jgi:hypothetical protein
MIEIDVRADEFLSLMERFSAQAPFVQSVALNRTSEEGLAVLRQGMKERFILRAEAFDLPPQQLPAAFRATASRLWATVRLGYSDGPASIGGRREAIFGKFEEGGTKRGPDPNFPIAIPTKALRSDPRALVPRQLYPRYLLGSFTVLGRFAGLKQGKAKHTRLGRGRSLFSYFQLTPVNRPGLDPRAAGIYERVGPGPHDVRRIWMYRTQIPIPRLLELFASVKQVVDARFGPNLLGALDLVLLKEGRGL